MTRIGGVAHDMIPPIAITFDDGALVAQSGCIEWIWDLIRKEEVVKVGGLRPIPVCERGRTRGEQRFVAIMETSPTVSRSADGMRIESGAGTIEARRSMSN